MKLNLRLISFLLVFLLVMPLVIVSATAEAASKESYIAPVGQIRHIGSSGGKVHLAVYNTLYTLSADGEILGTATASGQLKTCHVSGDTTYFVTDSGLGFGLETHSVYGGLINSSDNVIDRELYGYVTHIAVDDVGSIYFAVKNRELWCSSSGSPATLCKTFKDPIQALYCSGTTPVTVSGGMAYYGDDESPYLSLASAPVRCFDSDIYVDRAGDYRAGETLLFSSGVYASSDYCVSHYSDGEFAYYKTGERSVLKTDLQGNIRKKYRTDATVAAVCDLGIVTARDGGLYFISFENAELEATPKPAVNNGSSDLNNSITDNELLEIEAGTGVSFVAKKYGCEIYLDGNKVTSGKIRTGMIARYSGIELYICVPGDCNGSGTVNSADLKAIQEHIVGVNTLEGVYLIAADISRDGEVGTEDLMLLLKKF